MNETKSLLFEKINKIDKPLDRLFKQRGVKSTQLKMKKQKLQMISNEY